MNTISINLNVPQGWHELDDDQLRYVYSLIAKEFSADEIKTLALLKWATPKINVLGLGSGRSFLCSTKVKNSNKIFELSASQVAELMPSLAWLDSIPSTPVRLKKIRNHVAVDPIFSGVPFETYLVVENLYQGFLSTQKDALLDDLAHVLYPGCSVTLKPEERFSIFYWVASLKDMFARRFPDFFQPASANAENLLGSSPNIAKQLQESIDAQIRALTKGDITKGKALSIRSTSAARLFVPTRAERNLFRLCRVQPNLVLLCTNSRSSILSASRYQACHNPIRLGKS